MNVLTKEKRMSGYDLRQDIHLETLAMSERLGLTLKQVQAVALRGWLASYGVNVPDVLSNGERFKLERRAEYVRKTAAKVVPEPSQGDFC